MRSGSGGDFGGVVVELDFARQPDVVSCRIPRMTRRTGSAVQPRADGGRLPGCRSGSSSGGGCSSSAYTTFKDGHPAVRRVRAYRVRHAVVIGTATCPAASGSSASRRVTAGSLVCRRAAQWPPASRPDTRLAVRRWAADAEDAWADAEQSGARGGGQVSLSGAARSVLGRCFATRRSDVV
jgi:hypothetical protein